MYYACCTHKEPYPDCTLIALVHYDYFSTILTRLLEDAFITLHGSCTECTTFRLLQRFIMLQLLVQANPINNHSMQKCQ